MMIEERVQGVEGARASDRLLVSSSASQSLLCEPTKVVVSLDADEDSATFRYHTRADLPFLYEERSVIVEISLRACRGIRLR